MSWLSGVAAVHVDVSLAATGRVLFVASDAGVEFLCFQGTSSCGGGVYS
jgi:hypothetical protein